MDDHDPKLFIGALKVLNNLGMLHRFSVTPLDQSPDMLEYPDGWVQYPIIKQKLSKTEMLTFEEQVRELEKQKLESLATSSSKPAVIASAPKEEMIKSV